MLFSECQSIIFLPVSVCSMGVYFENNLMNSFYFSSSVFPFSSSKIPYNWSSSHRRVSIDNFLGLCLCSMGVYLNSYYFFHPCFAFHLHQVIILGVQVSTLFSDCPSIFLSSHPIFNSSTINKYTYSTILWAWASLKWCFEFLQDAFCIWVTFN